MSDSSALRAMCVRVVKQQLENDEREDAGIDGETGRDVFLKISKNKTTRKKKNPVRRFGHSVAVYT